MPKLSVEYEKQAVPAFIARFKAETGYQEHDIKDKHGDLDDDGKVSFGFFLVDLLLICLSAVLV